MSVYDVLYGKQSGGSRADTPSVTWSITSTDTDARRL